MEGANWAERTIMVHINCLYPIQWEMIHTTHNCAPIQGVIRRSPIQNSTGMDSTSHTIWLYEYMRMA